uniref:Uncharacterized protein n=1 Tax=Plectus sambesii TaxID=2011161 RepID=A0A914XD36_9BILA
MERQQSLEDTEHAERKESPTSHKGFVSAASEVLHEVAEKTREFAHEVKEKFTGHVTDHDISKATNHLDELRGQLAQEQHELREIQRQALLAEQTLNLKDYENLKEQEIKAKKTERATEIKIHEANDHLDHLLYEHRLHQLRQKCSEREHHHASSSTHPPTLTPPHSPKIFTMPVPMN